MKNKPITPAIAGVIIGALLMLCFLLIMLSGQQQNSSIGFLIYAVVLAGLIFLITQYGKAYNYHKTFGELFGYGFKATAVFTLIYLLFIGIMVSMTPEFKEKALDAIRVEMEKQNRPDGEIDTAIQMTNKYFMIAMLGGTLFGMVLCGTIGSLIGAAVTKKNPVNPLDQLDA